MPTIKPPMCPNLSIDNFSHCSRRRDSALILIAAQNDTFRTCLRRGIEREGCQVVEASTGEQCLDSYVRICPDLVFLDADISEMDGFTCCRKLNGLLACHPAPILMMISLSDQTAVERAFAAGAADCVIKPVHRALWSHRMRSWLRQFQLAKQVRQLSNDLACQVRRRTARFAEQAAQPQSKFQFDAMLKRLSDKLSDSPNESQILKTLVEEFALVLAHTAELEILNQHQDDFLSTFSHELRSPICNMRLITQILGQSLSQGIASGGNFAQLNPDFTRCAAYLKILQDECDQLGVLIDNLLEFQQLEAGEQPIEPTPISLQDWIPYILEPFQARAQAHQLSLQIELAPELPPIVSNPIRLKRILAELLNNACKYTPPGESISLNVTLESDRVQLSVTNSGVEIPTQMLNRIFDKFYRIPNGDIWQQGGSGLGLALVKELVNALGGSIRAESSAGQTCFVVELPINP